MTARSLLRTDRHRTAPQRRHGLVVAVAALTALSGLAGCGQSVTGDEVAGQKSLVSVDRLAGASTNAAGVADAASRSALPVAQRKRPHISLGAGFFAFPGGASQWVAAHRGDRRAPVIARSIASQPTALWLTGDESFGNLDQAVRSAAASNRTMILSIYNIPMRYDGLSSPTSISLADYEQWIDRVAATIGSTRAILILEPDALWFYDRMATDADRDTRMTALNYAVDTLASTARRARVYLEAGTSSGSVAPDRMAALLVQAGMSHAAGYAVNVSSYSPRDAIHTYAQQVRAGLQARGIDNPRYVVDTGRNGAAEWNHDWCNPSSQRLGTRPKLVRSPTGLDLNLWIKAPGTSDGDCGPRGGGKGTYGGEFIPSLAYTMAAG